MDGEVAGEAGAVTDRQWPTDKYLRMERQLGMSPSDYIQEALDDGRSARRIAQWLSEDAGLRISEMTVREWIDRAKLRYSGRNPRRGNGRRGARR
jgi:hypothetical protein